MLFTKWNHYMGHVTRVDTTPSDRGPWWVSFTQMKQGLHVGIYYSNHYACNYVLVECD